MRASTEIALDELRWLLSDCAEFIAAHVLLGELAVAAGDLPLARGHFGAGYQLGLQTLRRAKMPKPLLYSQPANRPFFEAGRGLDRVAWRSSASARWRMRLWRRCWSSIRRIRCKLRAMVDALRTGGAPIVSLEFPRGERARRIRDLGETRPLWRVSPRLAFERYVGQRAKTPLGRRRPSAVSRNSSPALGGWPQWPKMPSARYAASSAGPMPGEWQVTSTNARFSAVSSPHSFKQRQQVFVDLPRLALGAVAVAWAGRGSRRRIGCRVSARAGRTSSRLRRSSGSADRRGRRVRRSARARSTMFWAASMWTTSAPAAAAASVLPPV